jgi:pilus assembly protein CpaE
MPTYLVSSDPDVEKGKLIEQKIRGAIPDLIKLGSLEEVVQKLSAKLEDKVQDKKRDKSHVLVIIPAKDLGYLTRLADLASRHRDRAYFVLISDDIPASDYKRLVRTGAGDWVSASAIPQELLDIMSRSRSGSDVRGVSGNEPVVVCFAPSAGGVGNTTLVVEVAAHLKRNKATKDRAICIVDLDFQSGHVCDHLDIEPRLQIQEISNDPERLDTQLFEIFISHHSSGLDVFAAPRTKFDFCNVTIEALDMLFDMISARYDLVLIDLPVSWFTWTFHIISAADAVIITGTNTIPGLRQMAENATAIRDMRRVSAQFAVAVNRCERRLLGGIERRHHVEKIFGREKIFFVAEDPLILQAANTGMPSALTGPAGKANKEIAGLATFCAELKSARVKPG